MRKEIEKQACCAGCRRRPFTAEAPPIGKIHPFSKIAVTFEPVMRFGCFLRFRISLKIVTQFLWLKAPSSTIRTWRRREDIFTNHDWINELMEVIVEQPLALPGSAKDQNVQGNQTVVGRQALNLTNYWTGLKAIILKRLWKFNIMLKLWTRLHNIINVMHVTKRLEEVLILIRETFKKTIESLTAVKPTLDPPPYLSLP